MKAFCNYYFLKEEGQKGYLLFLFLCTVHCKKHCIFKLFLNFILFLITAASQHWMLGLEGLEGTFRDHLVQSPDEAGSLKV